MTSEFTTATPDQASSPRAFLRRAVGFWTGADKSTAAFLTIAVLLLVFANSAVSVGINRWNKWFFDALESKDWGAIVPRIATILVLVAAGARFA